MINSKLVSIVIPIYNVEDYIEASMQSVTGQTYKNLEILCVDDCGQDSSLAIVERYIKEDPRIKILSHSRNMGLACARNTGVEAAKGDYIYFLDSDDFLSNSAIDLMVKSAIKHNSDLVFANTQLKIESGAENDEVDNIRSYLSFSPPGEWVVVTVDNFDFYLEKFPCVAWNKLFKAEFLRSNYISFVKQNVVHEDEGFHVKVLSNSPRISFVNEVGYFYRIRSNSIMQKAIDDWGEKIKALTISLDDALLYLNEHNKSEYVEMVKARPLYRHCYAAENKKKPSVFSKLIRIRVRKNHKQIQIFGITLYESKS